MRASASVLLVLIVGCGAGRPGGATKTVVTSAEAQGRGDDARSLRSAVVVAEPVRLACDLPEEAPPVVQFEHDSASLDPRDEETLAHVAACAASGRLGGGQLVLVGHTDPTGSAEYNRALGLYRAQAARLYLTSLGVPSERIRVESRGEREAKGADPAGWARDRRVEVHLSGDADNMGGAQR